jgi:glycosyltransferase involved in cell wall biosynthesis
MTMKVAFFTYPSAFQNVGGGEIQLLKTREYLEKRGVQVDLFDPWKGKVEEYDILHIFGSVKDCLPLAGVAKTRGVKVATSPVLWSNWRRAFHEEGSVRTKAGLVARHLTKVLFPAFPSSRRKLLAASDMLFPNSEAEKKLIMRLFSIPASKIRPVPNGVDASFAQADASQFRAQHGSEPFVLCVGRIEPRKNQLNLIRALRGEKRRLVLIGSPVSGSERYFESCRREGEGFTTFIKTIWHGDGMLASAYAACDLFVLPGWFETPGLAALEASLAGARVVVTQEGSTREYFEDKAFYLDPASVADIRRKVRSALESPRRASLKQHVLENFTWEHVADKYIGLYRELLSGKA